MADGSKYAHWYGNARHQHWRTPRYLFEPLHAEFAFTLDGAADEGNALLPLASTAASPIHWGGASRVL